MTWRPLVAGIRCASDAGMNDFDRQPGAIDDPGMKGGLDPELRQRCRPGSSADDTGGGGRAGRGRARSARSGRPGGLELRRGRHAGRRSRRRGARPGRGHARDRDRGHLPRRGRDAVRATARRASSRPMRSCGSRPRHGSRSPDDGRASGRRECRGVPAEPEAGHALPCRGDRSRRLPRRPPLARPGADLGLDEAMAGFALPAPPPRPSAGRDQHGHQHRRPCTAGWHRRGARAAAPTAG